MAVRKGLEICVDGVVGAALVAQGVRVLCAARKYEEALSLSLTSVEGLNECAPAKTLLALSKAVIYLSQDNLATAEGVMPCAEEGADLVDVEDRLNLYTTRAQLWIEYGFYDAVAAELRAVRELGQADGLAPRLYHKICAHVVGLCMFLRDFDLLRSVPVLREYSELPPAAKDEIARIITPYFAGMVTLSHEYLPMIRNFHYGHMPIVYRGLELLASKKERCLSVRVLLDLARVCSNMFVYDWVIDDQSGRTRFDAYIAYLEGYLELRDMLYILREKLRKIFDISDSHDDLQGTGWIFVSIASILAVSKAEQSRALLSKAYFRCLWRQADKSDMLLSKARDNPPPTRLLQFELAALKAFQYYVCEKWEAFEYHHEQALVFWRALKITRGSSMERHARFLPIHKLLCMIMAGYHMHHTLDHVKAVAAMESHRCMFLQVPGYNPERPFDHIPPRTTCVYFMMVLHLTEVWTCTKMDFEEYQNQVVPQLWCYNYYRKNKEGPGQGTLKLLDQVKDQAMFTAQQWENSEQEKEHHALSSVHLAIKVQLDSIAGIYKTYAQRSFVVPEDALGTVLWPSMPSSNQKFFLDMINANVIPGLGFACVRGAAGGETPIYEESSTMLVGVRDHKDPLELEMRYAANELRIAQHHLKTPHQHILNDRPFDGAQRVPTLENLTRLLNERDSWRVWHFTTASNSRRALLFGHTELTVGSIRAMEKFPKVELCFLAGHKPCRGETWEGPLGLCKALMERGVSVIVFSTKPLNSKKQLQLMAYFYTLLERFPDVAADCLMRLAMQQLRKTTNVFIEWGCYNIMGTSPGKRDLLELPVDWKWPRLFKDAK